jgi:hypothetical protein
MAKFYGQKEIDDINPLDDKKSVLLFKDNSQIVLPNKMIGVAVTDEVTDLTKLRDLRCFPVVAEVLEVLHSWDIKIDEVDFIDARVIISINESLKRAEKVLWGKGDDEKTMSDVNGILLSKIGEEAGVPSPFHPEQKQ